jgi:RNA polymerase sigma-70 factor (ECF subfamily)
MDTTPASLLERLRQPDDRAAWDELVAVVTPFLYGVARRHGLNDEEADDVIQDVWLTAVRTLPAFRYDARRSFRAWLATVFRRKLIDRRRRPSPSLTTVVLPEPAAPAEAFGEDEYRRWLAARALERLEKNFSPQQIFICREYIMKDRPAVEVAAELGVSVNAVYLAAGKALARLREYLRGLIE